MKKTRTFVNIDQADIDALDAYAKARRSTRAAEVRAAIVEYLQRHVFLPARSLEGTSVSIAERIEQEFIDTIKL